MWLNPAHGPLLNDLIYDTGGGVLPPEGLLFGDQRQEERQVDRTLADRSPSTTLRQVTIRCKEEPPSSPVDRLVPGRGEARSGVQSYRHRQPW